MHRDVVEEPSFTDECDLLRSIYPGLDDVYAHFIWVLSNDPLEGIPLSEYPHSGIRVYKTTPTHDTPAFRVLYRFTDDQVTLLAIDRA
jgi:hypothetical protein